MTFNFETTVSRHANEEVNGVSFAQRKFYRGLVIFFDPSSIFNDPRIVTLRKRIHYICVLFYLNLTDQSLRFTLFIILDLFHTTIKTSSS